MPRGGIKTAIGHWAQLMEGMQESPKAFYDAIEAAIKHREIPDCNLRRVYWKEGGFFSARRLYLRAKRGWNVVDICGAPFGNAFFASTWLCIPRPGVLFAVILAVVGILFGLDTVLKLIRLEPFNSFRYDFARDRIIELAITLVVEVLFVVGVVIFGIIRPLLFPPRRTFYRIDTAEMFFRAVHNAVTEVIQQLRTEQGLRLLSADELKPIMREFTRR